MTTLIRFHETHAEKSRLKAWWIRLVSPRFQHVTVHESIFERMSTYVLDFGPGGLAFLAPDNYDKHPVSEIVPVPGCCKDYVANISIEDRRFRPWYTCATFTAELLGLPGWRWIFTPDQLYRRLKAMHGKTCQ